MPRANVRYADVIAELKSKEFQGCEYRMTRLELVIYGLIAGVLFTAWWMSV